jgi:hypothetical protein
MFIGFGWMSLLVLHSVRKSCAGVAQECQPTRGLLRDAVTLRSGPARRPAPPQLPFGPQVSDDLCQAQIFCVPAACLHGRLVEFLDQQLAVRVDRLLQVFVAIRCSALRHCLAMGEQAAELPATSKSRQPARGMT